MRPIIAFCGLIGSGKTTAALHLVDRHGFVRVRFAEPLKAMLRSLGLSNREIDGDLKEDPCPLLGGKTPRWAMQLLGTEWGRQMIDPELWTRAWRLSVDALPPGIPVVADDCRFANEAAAVRAVSPNALVLRIVRPGVTVGGAHVSELQAFSPDCDIINRGSIAELCALIDDFVIPPARADVFHHLD